MSLPYYKLNPSEEIGNYQIMSLDHAAMGVWYLLRVCHLWQHQGRIPDDDGYISGLLRLGTEEWRAYREMFIKRGLIQVIDGCITIQAFREQWLNATAYVENQRADQIANQLAKRQAKILGIHKPKQKVKSKRS